jgi:methionine-rich copper-binding protein CopC
MENPMVRNTSLIGLMLMAGSLFATAASAHPKLTVTNPPTGAVIASSPKELRLSFNEGVMPKFSGVEVKNEKGEKLQTGQAVADPADKKQLVVPLSTALADGTYTVEWHAVSDDTHRVNGSYSFTIKH